MAVDGPAEESKTGCVVQVLDADGVEEAKTAVEMQIDQLAKEMAAYGKQAGHKERTQTLLD